MAAPQLAAAAARLPSLREEVAIFPGPAALDGSPTWTLHDPARNRFFRLGWPEFEMLSRWDAGSVDELIESVDAETTLQIEREDIDDLARFLINFDLIHVNGPQATAALMHKAEQQRESWGSWLLHNYLFMRIPLVRPDRFLSATYPYVRWVYSRTVAAAIVAIGFFGLYLIARQWDSFVHTFVDLLTINGALAFGATLVCMKVIHELGHAYTAKRFGCRVPNMGLAILVMVPVLYTDVHETWKLTSRHQRLKVGIAGVTAELCCAAIAACLWGFLPDGPARSAAFLVATTTWVTTVLINSSPFMRYDGYFLLSDWLEMPNLHTRVFALARWWLREKLFGFDDPEPEHLPLRRQRFLIAFAFLTWTYRFLLFLTIALIVYHVAFRALGIAMVTVEVSYFLVRPVMSEFLVWWRRRGDLRWNRHTLVTAGGVLALVALLVVPWRSAIEAPALFKSRQHVDIFVPDVGARVRAVYVHDGQPVAKNAKLVQLASPDLDYKLRRTQSEIDALKWQVNARGVDSELLERSQVTLREYQAAIAQYRALLDEKARLDVVSPIAGEVVDFADGLEPGVWLPAKARLLSVVDPHRAVVEAYIDESDLNRVAPGTKAVFHAQADDRIRVDLQVMQVARASTPALRDRALASVYGGPVEARLDRKNKELIPERTIYRVTLAPISAVAAPSRVLRGTVTMQGKAESFAARVWRKWLAVVIREAGP